MRTAAKGAPGSLLLGDQETPIRDASWTELVERIQHHDPEAMAELYHLVSRAARYYLLKKLGAQEAEDQLHEAFLAVLQPIQRGELRDPGSLIPYVAGVVRRRVAGQIGRKMRRRQRELDWTVVLSTPGPEPSPEEIAERQEQRVLAAQILQRISERDREILVRFYVMEQSRGRICQHMGLTDTQFRLFKSRAMARLGTLWERESAIHIRSPKDEPTGAAAGPSSSGAPRTRSRRAG